MQYGLKKKKIYNFVVKYKPKDNNKEKVKILDEKFIKKNKNKCKIVYKNKIYEIKEYFEDIDINYNHKDLIKFRLIFIHNRIDMSFIFNKCDSLFSLSDDETNENSSKSLKSISDISISTTFNVNNMEKLFFKCYSLESLPDISKWNTSNVKNMSCMLAACYSLKSLPDISKWNTCNVIDMSDMFSHCNSLESLPDISDWNTSNVQDMNCMF